MSGVVLIGGGARSGKSRHALERARELGPRRVFVATAEAGDAAMAERVARHRKERADEFRTVEEPRELRAALAAIEARGDADVVVVDCLTFWLANLLMDGLPEERILIETDRVVALLGSVRYATVVVTNEVGMGVHPETELGMRFRDLVGFANQRVAHVASEVVLGAMGLLIRLRPGPIEIVGGRP